VASASGERPASAEFDDIEQSVRDDVSTIKASSLLPEGIEVTGWVYDVKTGKISPVS
jgi:carbonic anhydrase